MQGVAGVGIITAGSVRAECAESLIYLTISGIPRWVYIHRAGPYLDDARNAVVRQFKEEAQRCDRLLMVDSDIEFKPADVQQLIDDDLPVVSGVYHNLFTSKKGATGGITPVVFTWDEDDERRSLIPIREWPDGALHEDFSERPIVQVEGVGAGFLMIRRDVLDVLEAAYGDPSPWFGEMIRDGVHFGEDLDFCVRCAEREIPIAVDRRVQVRHYKTVGYGGPRSPRKA